jgi:molybdate transport repressor ModE-like protein
MPDLGAFEVLLAVAQRGSINAAAGDLGVSQQAVSARIASIERQAGVRLVTRTRQGSTLTRAGVVVTEWAARLLEVAGELDAGLGALRQDQRTRLRVCASLTIAEHLLPGWLVAMRDLAARNGNDPVEVFFTAANSDTVVEQVRREDAEVGFVEGPDVPRGVCSQIIGHDALVLVVRPDHPWSRRRHPVTAAELAVTPLVSREKGSGTREALNAALQNTLGHGFQHAAPVLELSTTSAVRAAVYAGAGPAVLSELALADDLATHRLRRIALAGVDLHRDLRAVWVGPRQPPAGAVRSLIAHIMSRPSTRSAKIT